ncbi:MAG: hypothetical protein KDB84_12540 [Flavobacteriales bacterium]|nr:hypothetical protein [Flavobacteriales bacterium]
MEHVFHCKGAPSLRFGAFLWFLFCCTLQMLAQSDQERIQCIVDGVRSPHHAHQADLVLRDQQGVLLTRTDYNTRNLLLHVALNSTLDKARVNELLAPLGMSVRCFTRGPLDGSAYRHMDPRDCDGVRPER